jgi:tetratricopeptide (TPR) repeat protein
MNSRIEQFELTLEQKKDDPFIWYALGVEYKNEQNFDKSQHYFEQCMKRFPEYVPTYLQYGMLLADSDMYENAKAVLDVGIQKAKKAGNAHAASEMEGVLSTLA